MLEKLTIHIPNQPLLIRKAIHSDAAAIAAVSIKSWQESYQGIIDQDILDNLSLEQRTIFRQKLFQEAPNGHFVACLEDKIIGFCDAGPSRYSLAKGEIYAIYVLNELKSLGIGYHLFTEAKSYLYNLNLRPFLTMALTTNKHARYFYERQGGQLRGKSTYHIGDKSYPEVCYLFD